MSDQRGAAGVGSDVRRHDRYLLREGHFLGFGMGLVLSRWWWATLAWGLFVMTLWLWSMSHDQ